MRIHLFIYSFVLFALIGCSPKDEEDVQENYQEFIALREADKLPLELGIPFNCSPKHPGDLGVVPSDEFKLKDGDEYTITIDFYTRADIYNRQDPNNYSTLIVQYLDSDGVLQIDTLYNGQNCIEKRERNGHVFYNAKMVDRTYEIKKKSGDLFYFAVFNSPYGKVDFSSDISVNGSYDDPYYGMRYEYNLSRESFHITNRGVDYLIYSKAVYLP